MQAAISAKWRQLTGNRGQRQFLRLRMPHWPACRLRYFVKSFKKHPDVSDQVLRLLVARVRALTQRVNEFSSMHVKHRIYAELLRRARPDPSDQRRGMVSPPPVHSDIAARVSTRREMVARELKALERAGLLTKRRGALVITSVTELAQRLQSASE